MGRQSKEHNERRNELLTVAMKLFAEKGYGSTSVNDILNAVGVAKGTFYHYFKSKEALLDALVNGMLQELDDAFAALERETGLSALERLNRVFALTRQAEFDNIEATYAFISLYEKDENLLLRHKLEVRYRACLQPVFLAVLGQGNDDRTWRVPYPDAAAAVMATLFMGMLADGSAMMLGARQDPSMLDRMADGLRMMGVVMDRLLGLPEGSVHIIDEEEMKLFMKQLLNGGTGNA